MENIGSKGNRVSPVARMFDQNDQTTGLKAALHFAEQGLERGRVVKFVGGKDQKNRVPLLCIPRQTKAGDGNRCRTAKNVSGQSDGETGHLLWRKDLENSGRSLGKERAQRGAGVVDSGVKNSKVARKKWQLPGQPGPLVKLRAVVNVVGDDQRRDSPEDRQGHCGPEHGSG